MDVVTLQYGGSRNPLLPREDFFGPVVVSGAPVPTKGYDDGRVPPRRTQEEP
jgi:hypothetical protein